MTSTDRAAQWAKMTKAQRLAFLKQGQQLDTTSSARQTGVAGLKKTAKGN